ncbi:MAG TPA: hypothetical protein VMI54_22770, partial [Polyangiaceae bacterium]|nr:hypothetical protein [Polyangiaceae bacterium]
RVELAQGRATMLGIENLDVIGAGDDDEAMARVEDDTPRSFAAAARVPRRRDFARPHIDGERLPLVFEVAEKRAVSMLSDEPEEARSDC